jgi:hypothetical protein
MNMSFQLGSGKDPIILSDSESDSESIAKKEVEMHDHDHNDGSLYEDSPEPYVATGAIPPWNGARSSTRLKDDTSSPPPASSLSKIRKNKVNASFAHPPRIITRDQGAQTDLAALRTGELHGKCSDTCYTFH